MSPAALLGLTAALVWARPAAAAPSRSAQARLLQDVRFSPVPGAQVPLDALVTDQAGLRRPFGELLAGRPAVLVFAYTRCPMLCPEVLDGLVRALRAVPLKAGDDYRVIAASFDPRDTPPQVAARLTRLERLLPPAGARPAWAYLTGPAVGRLADAVDYHAVYDPSRGQYAHAAGFVVLTPAGRVSRAFSGIEYSPRDLRLALVEASGGSVGSWADQVLIYCYCYDPVTGRYGLAVMRVLRALALATLAALGGTLLVLSRRA